MRKKQNILYWNLWRLQETNMKNFENPLIHDSAMASNTFHKRQQYKI